MKAELKDTIFIVIYYFFLILAGSCSSNSRNQESDDSQKNDSILNAQVEALVDSTLSQYIGFELDAFNISNMFNNSDTIKEINGTGRSRFFDCEKLSITGSYTISQNLLSCKSLKAIHSDVGSVFEINKKYGMLLTYRMDSLTFLKKIRCTKKKKDDYHDRVGKAYANRTKVHFGISKDEYNRFGEDFQRNFYEGLIGIGAYELAKPIFVRDIFVGFEIIEIHDKSFSYSNVQINADLVKQEQLGAYTYESFREVYVCELFNMEIITRYDKFKRRNTHSLTAYWNEWLKIFY